LRRPPIPTLLPYTTLFRSCVVPETPQQGQVKIRVVSDTVGGFAPVRLVIRNEPNPKRLRPQFPGDEERVGARDGRDAVEHVRLRSEEHTSELQSRENLVCR